MDHHWVMVGDAVSWSYMALSHNKSQTAIITLIACITFGVTIVMLSLECPESRVVLSTFEVLINTLKYQMYLLLLPSMKLNVVAEVACAAACAAMTAREAVDDVSASASVPRNPGRREPAYANGISCIRRTNVPIVCRSISFSCWIDSDTCIEQCHVLWHLLPFEEHSNVVGDAVVCTELFPSDHLVNFHHFLSCVSPCIVQADSPESKYELPTAVASDQRAPVLSARLH